MPMSYTHLSQISPDKDNWTIMVRVVRMWDAINTKTNEEKMVLVEKKRGKRDLEVGAAMEDGGKKQGDGEERNGENLDLIVCGKIYGFICKMLT